MLRILLTIVIGALIGVGLGRLQASLGTSGFEERFVGSRAVLAEERGEVTREQLLQATGTPHVEVEGGTEFRFGTMQHGESMSHDFVFRNIGDGPLNLSMGGSTCKCTVGELAASILQPGEETLVSLTWTAQSIMPDFGQTATILTNDPNAPEVRLEVRGQIADSFVIEPSELALGDVFVTDEVKRTFHIFNYLEKSEELEDFAWTDTKTRDLVRISWEKVPLDPEKFPDHKNAVGAYQVTLEIKPGLPLGQINSRITFTTDQGEKVGTLEIPVSGRVTGEVMLVGGPSFDPVLNLLQMGNVQSSQGARVSLSLAVQGDARDTFQAEVVSVKPEEALQVSVGEPKSVGNRTYFPIHFEVPKGAPEAYYAGNNSKDFGKVVVRTNHELVREISIYVRVNVVK